MVDPADMGKLSKKYVAPMDCTSGHDPKRPDFNEDRLCHLQDYQDMVDLSRSRRWNTDGAQADSEVGSTIQKRLQVELGRLIHRGSHYQPRDGQRKERGSVHFREHEDSSSRGGTSQLSTTTTHPSCNCDDTDVDTTYRMCNSPSFSAATLFDTGAHTSFVNREVATWIELQAKGAWAQRRRQRQYLRQGPHILVQY